MEYRSLVVRITRLLALALALAVAPAATVQRAAAATPAQDPPLEPYVRVDLWPASPPPLTSLIADPQGLDVAADGRAYISDRTAGGVVTVEPDGTFRPPFGAAGASGPGRLITPGRLVVDQARQRVYVLDNGSDRVVAYDLDGGYVTDWPTAGVGLTVAPDGTVLVADGATNQLKAFSPDGAPKFSFGQLGLGPGEFTLLTDVSVSPDGQIVAVGDKSGLRVQMFDLLGDRLRYRRDYDLQAAEYSQYELRLARCEGNPDCKPVAPYFHCRSGLVHALGEDAVWVGDGTGSCRIRPEGFDYTIASSVAASSVCKLSMRLPRLRPDTGQYLALGTYNPNVGPCYSPSAGKDTRLDTTPALLRFADESLRQLTDLTLASDELPLGALVGPRRIGLPAPDQVFVQDQTPNGHAFGPDGSSIGDTAGRDRWQAGRVERTWLELTEGTGVPGEVFGYYRKQRYGKPEPWSCGQQNCPPKWLHREHGLGRYRTQAEQVRGRDVLVLDAIWEKPFSLRHPSALDEQTGNPFEVLEVVDIAFDARVGALYALVNELPLYPASPDSRLVRLDVGNPARPLEIDLPEEAFGRVNLGLHSDLSADPDGGVVVLDPSRAEVTRLTADGIVAGTTSAPGDTWRVAGGPGETYFALRRSGFIERRGTVDGAIQARFDARLDPRSDPAALTDLAADATGRVYVADGAASVVQVFEPGGAGQPRPDEGRCTYTVTKDAAPDRVVLGEGATIDLALSGQCGLGTDPVDVMIVTQGPRSTLWVRRALEVIAGVDLRRHRIGLVEVSRTATLRVPLTHDRTELVRSLGRIRPADHPTSLKQALVMAQEQFGGDAGRRRVILVLPTYYCSRSVAGADATCQRLLQGGWSFPPAEDAAAAIVAQGTIIVVDQTSTHGGAKPEGWCPNNTRCPRHAYILASGVDKVIGAGEDPIPFLLDFAVPEHLATNLRLVDGLPGNMRYVPDSAVPAASVGTGSLSWDQATVPPGGARFRFEVEPQSVGRWPTNTEAVATFTDGWGNPQRLVFPVPVVEVVGATPTPPEPTATSQPTVTGRPTRTPPATASPEPSAMGPRYRLFLPALLRAAPIPGP